ncbi:MAG: hypothetical protein H6738_00820 [Alphaproteobacteria bacterium]|nr:hypothetical protein [Alphaproteobacteria bacterium]MCB9695310.1 hypothetical protein [Alphaproteobacteria bacterium]
MLDELGPVGLADAARELGCEPFDVIQLAVSARGGIGSSPLVFTRAELEKMRGMGGFESTWWTDVQLPADASPELARVRAAVQQLQMRGYVGDKQTRVDNVWRGLDLETRDLLRRAIAALVADGLLVATGTSAGIQVSIAAGGVGAVQDLVGGKATPESLKAELGE